jgi:signal transduction histidine kinase
VRDVPGTGLGLTIVRTILEQHGSTIHVESTVHQGTTFRFCLPYAR